MKLETIRIEQITVDGLFIRELDYIVSETGIRGSSYEEYFA